MSEYSEIAMEHIRNPRNVGTLENPDGIGQDGIPGKGNFMIIQVKYSGKVVTDAKFQTYGCPGAICCGSMITTLAVGKTILELQSIDVETLSKALGGLPLGKGHCAGLAVSALKKAIISNS